MNIISNFSKFNESNIEKNSLLYYAFDWDDNILNMTTVIHMENLIEGIWVPTDVSTAQFAEVRSDSDNWRLINNNPDEAFSEFRDFGSRGDQAFIEDVQKAISMKKFGPAWNDFIECLTNGSLFAIVTARGHESEPMRKGVEWIIDNILSEDQTYEMYNNLLKFSYIFKSDGEFERIHRGKTSESKLVNIYLDNCEFIGVSSPSRGGTPTGPEQAKQDALLEFSAKINNFSASVGAKAKIGFSDDDLKNVKHIEDLFDNIDHEKFPSIIHYVVKGTKDPNNITKKTRSISESSTPGLESSVMPFTQFNNMTNRLYPKGPYNRMDDYVNQFQRQVKFLDKNSKEILKNKKSNKKSS